MIAQYFSSIAGIEIVGIAALVISLSIFLAVALRAMKAPDAEMSAMAQLPLDDSPHHTHEVDR